MNPPTLQNYMISDPQLCMRQVSQVFIAIDHSSRSLTALISVQSVTHFKDPRCVGNELMLRSETDPLNQDL